MKRQTSKLLSSQLNQVVCQVCQNCMPVKHLPIHQIKCKMQTESKLMRKSSQLRSSRLSQQFDNNQSELRVNNTSQVQQAPKRRIKNIFQFDQNSKEYKQDYSKEMQQQIKPAIRLNQPTQTATQQMKKPKNFINRLKTKIFSPSSTSQVQHIQNVVPEQQQKIQCTFCGYMQTFKELDTHPNQCQSRGKICQYCHENYPLQLIREHYLVCSSNQQNYRGRNGPLRQPQQHLNQFRQVSSSEGSQDEDQRGNNRLDYRENRGQQRQGDNNGGVRIHGRLNTLFNFIQAISDIFEVYQEFSNENNPVGGLSKDQLNRLKRYTFSQNMQRVESQNQQLSDKKQSQDLCAICYCNFEDDQVCLQLRCKHVYHEECIKKWLQKNCVCPVCKRNQKELLKKQREISNDIGQPRRI